jgi:hypothetical protein
MGDDDQGHDVTDWREYVESRIRGQLVSPVRCEETGGLKGPYRALHRPYWNLLEERFVLLLVNARHIRQVPGRKTDVADSEWIADLLRHGLLKASFVPDRNQRNQLRTALVVAAQAASHKPDSYLSAQHRRLAARRGPKKAIVALAHTLLVIAYHVLKRRVNFTDLGPAYFDERNRVSVQRQLVRRLERIGYKVALEPMAA